MTSFPINCFSLIKEFADINEAKYHQKKVAQIVKNHIEFCRVKYDNRKECFPLVYHIQYLEEPIAKHKETIRSYGAISRPQRGGLALLLDEIDELEVEVFQYHCHLRWVLYL